ncbi:MAG: glycerate kinase [Deltaproteobacteria bacterium]|nr:glycerate kinase [Deltaproteobacteria bacterium]
MSRERLLNIFNSALFAADPYNAVKKTIKITDNRLKVNDSVYDLKDFNRVIVIGAGKGTALMAQAVEETIGDRLDEGIIIVKYGHTWPLQKIKQIEAGHPIPDEAGVKGTEEIVRLLEKADEKTLVICLLSGGGSALLVSPADGITLKDKQVATDLLLKSGATIDELNVVRKHLSKVKGGRLAQTAFQSTILTLALSDVIGDRLDVIASGPTVADGTTFLDAVNVIQKYDLVKKVPERVIHLLLKGTVGKLQETPKKGDLCFKNKEAIIVGSLKQALNAARSEANKSGFDTEVVTDKLQGEARDAAKYLAEIALLVKKSHKGIRPRCLLSGGETVVTVKGDGLGGRNQELALAFALEIEGTDGITMLSAGTDGTDGPTDAAGAVVDGETAAFARKLGVDPDKYLENNDSYNFFKKIDQGHHLITGPTGTNVMDVQIIMVE